MNQFYAPNSINDFLTTLTTHNNECPIFIISNNLISKYFVWQKDERYAFINYIKAHLLIPSDESSTSYKLFVNYYNIDKNDFKPFDIVSAHILVNYIKTQTKNDKNKLKLLLDKKSGITIINNYNKEHYENYDNSMYIELINIIKSVFYKDKKLDEKLDTTNIIKFYIIYYFILYNYLVYNKGTYNIKPDFSNESIKFVNYLFDDNFTNLKELTIYNDIYNIVIEDIDSSFQKPVAGGRKKIKKIKKLKKYRV
jgi:hypothetical protein